jgi:hypothetical protein
MPAWDRINRSSAFTLSGNSAAGNPNDPDIDNSGPNGYGGAIDEATSGPSRSS